FVRLKDANQIEREDREGREESNRIEQEEREAREGSDPLRDLRDLPVQNDCFCRQVRPGIVSPSCHCGSSSSIFWIFGGPHWFSCIWPMRKSTAASAISRVCGVTPALFDDGCAVRQANAMSRGMRQPSSSSHSRMPAMKPITTSGLYRFSQDRNAALSFSRLR